MFELRSAARFIDLAPDAAQWIELAAIEAEHHHLLAEIDTRFGAFSQLDDRFHRLIHNASRNRFVLEVARANATEAAGRVVVVSR